MTSPTPVTVLLAKLHRCHQAVSDVFYETRILKTDENALDIEMLRHFRLLSPDVRDAFRLRGSFRQFLNTVLSTERLYAIGANIGGHFERLTQLIDEHAYAFNEARDTDCERYEVDIREAISDVADAIEDDLSFLDSAPCRRWLRSAVKTFSTWSELKIWWIFSKTSTSPDSATNWRAMPSWPCRSVIYSKNGCRRSANN